MLFGIFVKFLKVTMDGPSLIQCSTRKNDVSYGISTISVEFSGLSMSCHPALACLVNSSMERGSDVLDHHNLASKF